MVILLMLQFGIASTQHLSPEAVEEMKIRTDGLESSLIPCPHSLPFTICNASLVVLNAWGQLCVCVHPRDVLGVRNVR